jgi:hypothetical protein
MLCELGYFFIIILGAYIGTYVPYTPGIRYRYLFVHFICVSVRLHTYIISRSSIDLLFFLHLYKFSSQATGKKGPTVLYNPNYVSVSGPKHSFWFGGDTGYCEAFKQIGVKYGPFSMAAIPIGQNLLNFLLCF